MTAVEARLLVDWFALALEVAMRAAFPPRFALFDEMAICGYELEATQ